MEAARLLCKMPFLSPKLLKYTEHRTRVLLLASQIVITLSYSLDRKIGSLTIIFVILLIRQFSQFLSIRQIVFSNFYRIFFTPSSSSKSSIRNLFVSPRLYILLFILQIIGRFDKQVHPAFNNSQNDEKRLNVRIESANYV